jgi:hypothetical protein
MTFGFLVYLSMHFQLHVYAGQQDVNNELGRTCKKVVKVYFKVLSQHFHGKTEENHIKSVKTGTCWPAIEPGTSQYRAAVLTTQL